MATANLQIITDAIIPLRNRVKHPLYYTWNERKNQNLLCEEWLNFDTFVEDVGNRPNNCKLKRLNDAELFSPSNFKWHEYSQKKIGEKDNEYLIRRRQENPEVYKNAELKKNFGITLADYNEKLKAQNYVCSICEEPEKVIHHVSGKVKSLAVDHCHTTGEVRGLLCQRCNRTLGKLKDSIDLLDKMKVYLNEHR